MKELVGDYKFSRQLDNQLAVTVSGTMEDLKTAWHLRSHNVTFNIYHHVTYDGTERVKFKNMHTWFDYIRAFDR